MGEFSRSNRPHHKTVLSNEEYQLSLGIVHPDDTEVFQALINALVPKHTEFFWIARTRATITVIEMDLRTMMCIKETGDVTTMFPHRWTVFN